MLILQLFVFALLSLGFGIYAIFRKKYFVGFTFILLGIFLAVIGLVVIYLYPHTLPF